jgi:signal transduction histidine kinase
MKPVVKEMTPAIQERNLNLNVNIPADLPMVVGDDTQLAQVFSRLMGNALKYTPDCGKITISACVHTNDQTNGDLQEFIEVSVADTGIGIDKKYQTLIFEKFYTVEDSALHSSGKTKFMGGGPGLGLTIAKGIVEAHGGRMWVESDGYDPERNPGSTFYVLLPTEQEG